MTGKQSIPFLDLVNPHQELEQELTQVFKKTIETAGFIGGPMVEKFEQEFAEFCGSKHCIGVGSGTDALRFALIASGIGAGDIVVTVPNSFIATTEAISQAGAQPRFVDIDSRTYNIDAKKVQDYLENSCSVDTVLGAVVEKTSGKSVKAIVPVHLYGQMADMDRLIELAAQFNLILIEDACQAHGAEYFSKKENRWRTAGTMGNAAAFSFYPGKNLGACGEAGAITTDDERLARMARMLRDHGQSSKYYHEIEGFNGRLDSLQAGILSVKLRHLHEWNRKRKAAAKRYDELFSQLDGVTKPYCPEWARAIYHLYVIRACGRENLQKWLAQASIGTGIHYPVPLHLQKAYEHLGYRHGDFPVTEAIAAEIVSLPMFPGLGVEQQDRVVAEVSQFLQAGMASQNLVARRD